MLYRSLPVLVAKVHADPQVRENKGSVASTGTLWVANKSSLRGVTKGCVRRREAQQSQRITVLEGEMANLECRARQLDGEELRRQLAFLRAELWQVSLVQARQCWQASTQRVYELGDMTGKLLYQLATRDVSARVVPLIRDLTGAIREDLLAIAHTFASYYVDLYAQVPSP
ncbi:hypothetical protein NDU88_006183 [Pleurodeles waltl]|uniref:Uncharacterized protein n=1 Tax=Pleurodeles waltl TaxID=8319 RepID=A0AAV7N3B8_PLEWA|nr:hypothetical protein NDU88_006183 [Pleurodeles waltl]